MARRQPRRFASRVHAFGNVAKRLENVLQPVAARQLETDPAVARQIARRGEDEIARSGETHEGLGGAPQRHTEAGDFRQSAGNQCRARVLPESKTVGDARRDRHDILDRAGNLV